MRPAGARLMELIADNALTRSWANSVNLGLVRPLERMGLDDAGLRQALGQAGARYLDEGKVTDEFADRLRLAAKAGGLPPEEAEIQVMGARLGQPLVEEEMAAGIRDLLAKADRPGLRGIEAEMIGDPTAAYSKAGGVVNFLLGNPIAAYGAVAGGGALGTMGVMELARRIQEMQQGQQE